MIRRALIGALAAALLSPTVAAAECRQALVLGLDISGSVDTREFQMQRNGLAAALLHPDVLDALLALPGTPVQIAVFEWSGPDAQAMLADWHILNDAADVAALAGRITAGPRRPSQRSTALGQAMLFGARLLAQRPDCWVRTLDISGDGTSNTGPVPLSIPDADLGGIIINALVIGSDAHDHGDDRQAEISALSSYFRTQVIRGPGSFVEVALGFEDYENAMIRKLRRELSGLSLSQARGLPDHQ